MKFAQRFLRAVFFCCAVLVVIQPLRAQNYIPGTSYFGRSNYIEYIAGNLPFIISEPHGGTNKPSEIPDRTYGTFATDSNVELLIRNVKEEIAKLTGHFPHVIICRLDRDKIDCNREIVEGAQGDPEAEQAWNEFQNYIIGAKTNIAAQFGRGFYIDLHGHGHDIQRLELGYLLTSSELANSDSTLNSTFWENQASIRKLSQNSPLTFPSLLRGSNSFGAFMEDEGYASVPSDVTSNPGTNDYFNGGYNTVQHGSLNGGVIDGMQIESNFTGVRDTSVSRTNFAKAMARILDKYFILHYGMNLRTVVPSVWTNGSGSWATSGNWLGGALPVSTNHLLFTGGGGSVTHNLAALTTGTGFVVSISFSNSVSAAYTISGNAISLLGGVTNNSSVNHTINNALTLAGSQTFNAANGALTFSAAITNGGSQLKIDGTTNTTISGVIYGTGGLTKSGAGLLALQAINAYSGNTTNFVGTISVDADATFGDGAGLLVLAGGGIRCANSRSIAPISNSIVITGNCTIYGDSVLTNSTRILPFSADSILTTGGILTIRNSGTNVFAMNNLFQIRLNGGGFNFSRPIVLGHANDLPVCSSELEFYSDNTKGDQTVSGNISGAGSISRDAAVAGGRTILSGSNTYSGGTTISSGTLLVNNTAGSGTGSGSVTVNSGATLGGTGTVGGTVSGSGTVSPGMSAGALMLQSGLNLSSGGTYLWEISVNSAIGAGTNFDQIKISGGNLTLGGSSKLSIQFTGTASSPDTNVAFWRYPHSWRVIALNGATNPGNTAFSSIINGGNPAGSFFITTDANGILLNFAPITPPTAPLLTTPFVSSAGTNAMLAWSAVSGLDYQVQFKNDLNASNWSLLGTLTAVSNMASFVDTSGSSTQRFYRVVIP